jgi:hypothetical protein
MNILSPFPVCLLFSGSKKQLPDLALRTFKLAGLLRYPCLRTHRITNIQEGE